LIPIGIANRRERKKIFPNQEMRDIAATIKKRIIRRYRRWPQMDDDFVSSAIICDHLRHLRHLRMIRCLRPSAALHC
jgi:hypothetical protein